MTAEVFLEAVKAGDLKRVLEMLDADIDPDLRGADGPPGLPLAMASFLGHVGIVRALVRRGAAIDPPPGVPAVAAPIRMAARGKRTEVARTLIEMGAHLPADLDVGLRPEEIAIAQQVAQHLALAAGAGEQAGMAHIETIEMQGLYGTDTNVLELEASQGRGAVRDAPEPSVNAPDLDFRR